MVLMVSNQDGVLVDEFGIPIYDENGEINEDQLDDYQKNPDGLQVGDKITVVGKGLRFYHVRKFQVRWRVIAEFRMIRGDYCCTRAVVQATS